MKKRLVEADRVVFDCGYRLSGRKAGSDKHTTLQGGEPCTANDGHA
jgi:hypothetical protein